MEAGQLGTGLLVYGQQVCGGTMHGHGTQEPVFFRQPVALLAHKNFLDTTPSYEPQERLTGLYGEGVAASGFGNLIDGVRCPDGDPRNCTYE